MAKFQQKPSSASVDAGLLEDGSVVLQFNELIRHITFSPEQAVGLGTALIKLGAHGESVQRVQPPSKTQKGPKRVV